MKSLLFVTRRCIDVIEFLKMISFEGNQLFFQQLLNNLRREDQKTGKTSILRELAGTCFRDLVLEGSSED